MSAIDTWFARVEARPMYGGPTRRQVDDDH